MSDYIEKVFAESKPTTSGVAAMDLDQLMSGLHYDNELRFVSNPFEFRRYRNIGVRASYVYHYNNNVHVDFFWGCKHINYFPVGYPKDGIGKDGKAIWESCFCITFLTPRSIERGRAKKVILPAFSDENNMRCYVKAHMRASSEVQKQVQVAFCSMSQLEALEAILRRFDETGDEEGIEFAASIPCELVVQNG